EATQGMSRSGQGSFASATRFPPCPSGRPRVLAWVGAVVAFTMAESISLFGSDGSPTGIVWLMLVAMTTMIVWPRRPFPGRSRVHNVAPFINRVRRTCRNTGNAVLDFSMNNGEYRE